MTGWAATSALEVVPFPGAGQATRSFLSYERQILKNTSGTATGCKKGSSFHFQQQESLACQVVDAFDAGTQDS
jgi:hypothetical protein